MYYMSHNHFCQINNAAPVLAHQSGKHCSEDTMP
nr:MAG TPA: hypothetical protein [Caudoviricetes sp.]